MQKTADANDVKKYLNLFFNPFEYKNLPKTPTETSGQTALKHAGGLALGAGSLGLLLRYIKKAKDDAERTANSDKMKAYLAAKNPILSMDKSKRDKKKEEKLRRLGAETVNTESELLKRASEILKESYESPHGTGANANTLYKAWKGTTKQLGKISDKDVHPAHMAAAIIAALAGGYGGYKLGERQVERRTQNKLDEEISDRENEIDKLLLEEYNRVRQKTASEGYCTFEDLMTPFPTIEKEAMETALEKMANDATYEDFTTPTEGGSAVAQAAGDPVGTLGRGAASLYSLYAILTLAAGYKAARTYWDAKDPNRERIEQLKKVIDEKGKVKGTPSFIDLSPVEQQTQRKPKKTSVEMQAKRDNKNPSSKTTVDESDPYAKLLEG
jgi:hypothetical protein